MEYIMTYILPILVIIALVWVTTVALKNIGKFGGADIIKKEAFFRTLFNFVSILILIILLYAKEKNIINETYSYSTFTGIVVGLGIKMVNDFKNKNGS